jgi:hypothetical protein
MNSKTLTVDSFYLSLALTSLLWRIVSYMMPGSGYGTETTVNAWLFNGLTLNSMYVVCIVFAFL